jgi:hypothetical protein
MSAWYWNVNSGLLSNHTITEPIQVPCHSNHVGVVNFGCVAL